MSTAGRTYLSQPWQAQPRCQKVAHSTRHTFRHDHAQRGVGVVRFVDRPCVLIVVSILPGIARPPQATSFGPGSIWTATRTTRREAVTGLVVSQR